MIPRLLLTAALLCGVATASGCASIMESAIHVGFDAALDRDHHEHDDDDDFFDDC